MYMDKLLYFPEFVPTFVWLLASAIGHKVTKADAVWDRQAAGNTQLAPHLLATYTCGVLTWDTTKLEDD